MLSDGFGLPVVTNAFRLRGLAGLSQITNDEVEILVVTNAFRLRGLAGRLTDPDQLRIGMESPMPFG